jgi:hypothetical protein
MLASTRWILHHWTLRHWILAIGFPRFPALAVEAHSVGLVFLVTYLMLASVESIRGTYYHNMV